jgi:hypothetical protein
MIDDANIACNVVGERGGGLASVDGEFTESRRRLLNRDRQPKPANNNTRSTLCRSRSRSLLRKTQHVCYLTEKLIISTGIY